MCNFSEIKAIPVLTSSENSSLHIFGISETKLKPHKLSTCFNVQFVDFKHIFAKVMTVMAVEVPLFISGMA